MFKRFLCLLGLHNFSQESTIRMVPHGLEWKCQRCPEKRTLIIGGEYMDPKDKLYVDNKEVIK